MHDRGECAPGPDPVDGRVIAFGAAGRALRSGPDAQPRAPGGSGTVSHAGDLPPSRSPPTARGRSPSSPTTSPSTPVPPPCSAARCSCMRCPTTTPASPPAALASASPAASSWPSPARSLARHALPGGDFFPEGIAYDARRQLAYVGSAGSATSTASTSPPTPAAPFALGGSPGRTTALGLELDRHGRLLVAGGATGAVAVLGTGDGEPAGHPADAGLAAAVHQRPGRGPGRPRVRHGLQATGAVALPQHPPAHHRHRAVARPDAHAHPLRRRHQPQRHRRHRRRPLPRRRAEQRRTPLAHLDRHEGPFAASTSTLG